MPIPRSCVSETGGRAFDLYRSNVEPRGKAVTGGFVDVTRNCGPVRDVTDGRMIAPVMGSDHGVVDSDVRSTELDQNKRHEFSHVIDHPGTYVAPRYDSVGCTQVVYGVMVLVSGILGWQQHAPASVFSLSGPRSVVVPMKSLAEPIPKRRQCRCRVT
jgi:hypothetical protein